MPAGVGDMRKAGQWRETDILFPLSFKPRARLQNAMLAGASLVFWISLCSMDSAKISSFVSGDYLLILDCSAC